MKFRNAYSSDIKDLVKVHKGTFDNHHFTKHFPDALLQKYFLALINNMCYKIVFVDNNDKILSYLFADNNNANIIRSFFKKNLIRISGVLLSNPRFIYEKIIDLLILKRNKEKSGRQLTIYLLATKAELKRKGLGQCVLKYFENLIFNNGIKNYLVYVRNDNYSAIRFYTKNGFILNSTQNNSRCFERNLSI